MGGLARAELREIKEFNRHWENLFEKFPVARAEAVEAMGKSVKKDLDEQILKQNVRDNFFNIRSAQTLRLGSKGGWAAVSPRGGVKEASKGRNKTWHGSPVSTRMVTKWLEKGHGARKPSGLDPRYRPRIESAGIGAKGNAFVRAHMFYSWTRLKALDHALAAARKVLEIISDEVVY